MKCRCSICISVILIQITELIITPLLYANTITLSTDNAEVTVGETFVVTAEIETTPGWTLEETTWTYQGEGNSGSSAFKALPGDNVIEATAEWALYNDKGEREDESSDTDSVNVQGCDGECVGGGGSWLPDNDSFPMQCGSCGPYAVQTREIGYCYPAGNCGCEEETFAIVRRVKTECKNETYDLFDVILNATGCCGICGAALIGGPLPFAICAVTFCPACFCHENSDACGGCKLVEIDKILITKEGCL